MESAIDVGLIELANLQKQLSSRMVEVDGPHDWNHPVRMLSIGKDLRPFIDFDDREFRAAVILHNIDRIKSYASEISEKSFEIVSRHLISGIGFSEEAQDRIIDAVVKHSKLDKPGDTSLLTALRSADRIDWLGPLGITGAAYMWGINGMYGDSDPFTPPEGKKPRNFYQDAIRQTEWYGMLPSDDIRSIADPSMPGRLFFLRSFANEISIRHGVQNMIERDLRKALGHHYSKWSR